MPLIGKNGKRISKKDLNALKDMLRGSLENHIKRITDENTLQLMDNRELAQPIASLYQNALDHLDETIDNAHRKYRNVSVDNFTRKLFDDISKNIPGVVDANDPEREDKLADIKNFIIGDFGNDQIAKDFTEGVNYDRNTVEGFNRSVSSFKLADVPMQDVDLIAPYEPGVDDLSSLNELRRENSETLAGKEDMQQNDIDDAVYLTDYAMTDSKGFAFDLKNKKTDVSFGDLWEVLSTLNRDVNYNAKNENVVEGGKLRGTSTRFGDILGPGISTIPNRTVKTLETIADYMNQIKKTSDPNLRKTRAIQLAAYSYQVLLSEHVFGDGNGRTARLFADTILQTFGLPPHVPSDDEMNIVDEIGKPFDFNKGANVFLANVLESNDILIAQKPEYYEKYQMEKTKRTAIRNADKGQIIDLGEDLDRSSRLSDSNKSLDISIDEHERDNIILEGDEQPSVDSLILRRDDKKEQIQKKNYKIDEETANYLHALLDTAGMAKGFKNSNEYTLYYDSIKLLSNFVDKTINDKKSGLLVNQDDINDDFEYYANKVKKHAKEYENYKLKNKTERKNRSSGKKYINRDDRIKLDLVRNTLSAKCLDVAEPTMLNSEFLKETENAIIRLQNKKYTNLDDYFEDAAYAMIGKMYAVSGGKTPTNKKTGDKMTLQEYKNMKIKSGEMQKALLVSENPVKYKNASSVARAALNDNKMKKLADDMKIGSPVDPDKVIKRGNKKPEKSMILSGGKKH